MKKINKKKIALVALSVITCSVISITSCKKEKEKVKGCTDPNSLNYNSAAEVDDGSCKYAFKATQANIDASITTVSLLGTGTTYGSASTPHDGNMANSDLNSTYRDVYTSLSAPAGTITEGTIFTKRVYKRVGTARDSLRATFAMIKREAGYWEAGGDWEYVMMPYGSTVNYTTNPNGMLPATADNIMRGKLTMCAGCHANSQTNGDFIFTNN